MSDNLTIKERLDNLVQYYGTQKALGDRLGVSQGAVAMYYRRNNYPIDLFLNRLDEISTDFIRFGKLPMFEYHAERDHDMALSILGITEEQLNAVRGLTEGQLTAIKEANASLTPSAMNAQSKTAQAVNGSHSAMNAQAVNGSPSSMNGQSVNGSNEEGTRTYESIPTTAYQVAEGEAVDRALLNMLLSEKHVLEQKLAALESRNLELERQNARLEERFAGATAWYHLAVATHPDLKK